MKGKCSRPLTGCFVHYIITCYDSNTLLMERKDVDLPSPVRGIVYNIGAKGTVYVVCSCGLGSNSS